MSIFVTCHTSDTVEEARAKVALAQEKYQNILRYFWISEVGPEIQSAKEIAAEHGLTANSGFLIQWNKNGGSEFIPEIPRIMYEVFGRDKLLVFDLNYELIR